MSKKSGKLLAISLLMVLLMSLTGPALQVFAEETAAAEYQVQKNDSLYKIARTQLGAGERWTEIYELNKDVIKDPSLIYTGQVLKLPGAEAVTEEVAPAEAEAEPAQEPVVDEQQEADKYATQLLDAATKKEPEITAILKALENDRAHLEGLEHRLKSHESLSRKILLNAHDMEVSIPEAAATITDILRYTFVIGDEDYVATTKQITDKLIAEGCAVRRFKNYWADEVNSYEGINALFQTPEGGIFELQFHTPTSFYVKDEETHQYYEIIRSETATAEEKAEASRKQDEAFAKIPVPEGVKDLKY